MTAVPQTGALSKPNSSRDPYLDNAKLLLIVLVVVGHLLERIEQSNLSDGIYTWIYLFHMPAFVFVSGYLSRSFQPTGPRLRSLVTSLLIPYLVFQIVLGVEGWLWRGDHLTINPLVPSFAMWYLLALFAWRLFVPLLRSIPYPLLWAVVISIGSVVYGGISDDLAGARILSFLPFFTFGLLTTPERIATFKRIAARVWIRIPITIFLACTLVGVYLLRDQIARRWLYMYGHYADFDFTNLEHMLLRAGLLVTATIMLLAVLALVPQRQTILTRLGRNTLYIYLLQAAVIFPLQPRIQSWDGWSAAWVAALMVGGVLLALALGTRTVQKATSWLVDPVGAISSAATALKPAAPEPK